MSVRAVVLLELDQLDGRLRGAEVTLEVLHVGCDRPTKRVDGLIVVADRENRCVRSREQLQPLVLQRVRILEFIDEDVREASLVMRAERVLPRQHLVGPEQKLGEIDHAFALASLLVQSVMLDLPTAELVEGLDLVRAQSFFLRSADQRLQLPSGKALVVDVVCLVHALDQRQLVLRVDDLKCLWKVRLAMVRAKHPAERGAPRPPRAGRIGTPRGPA